MTRTYRFLGLFVVLSIMAAGAWADSLGSTTKFRVRKRLCQLEDNCPTNDGGSAGPTGYTARIDQDPVTGANQSLVSFTISGAQNGDLFNWTLNDTNGTTPALSGNGTITGSSFRVSGVNAASLSDGTLTLRVEVSRGGVWGNPVTDTATKGTGGAGFATFSDGFDDSTATAAGQPLASNEVTVSGFAGSLSVSVSGDASAQVSIDSAPCAASGSIAAGQTVSLCANSPALDTSKTITVTIGSSSASWKIGTGTASGGGNLMCWGQINGTETSSLVPVAVSGMGGDVTAVSIGGNVHACAIGNGGLKCWGTNASGQLGDGTATSSQTPVSVTGMGSGVTAVVGGWDHTCALQNGALKCWGANASGQLGDGTTTNSPTPVAAPGMDSGITAIVAGGNKGCALQNGELKCWGDNASGQLGDGTTTDSSTPVAVVGMGSGVTAVSAGGYFHACAIQNGGLKCWGQNTYGQLGDGSTTGSPTPVAVIGMDSGVTAVAGGFYITCAIQNGGLKCWGRNNSGQLGDGTTTDSPTPVAVVGMDSGVTAVSAGVHHTCAMQNGALKCWGSNASGRLGDGTITDSPTPVAVSGMGSGVTTFAAGGHHTCALMGSAPSDTSAPAVSTLSPQPGSTDIAEDANLVITFGENAVKGTGNIVIKKLADGSVLETIPVTDARVTIAGKVATINPTGLFASNTAYYVEVAAGAFKDAADNAFAGISGSGTWAFTSEVTDFAPPLVSTLSPANGAGGVAVAANLVITFDEPVMKGSGNIVIRKSSDNTAFETIPVSDARVSVSGNAATINPTGTFASLTGYYVEVAAGAFRDTSANTFAGITGSGTWAFTSVYVDTTPPAVSTLSPADGASGVASDANLAITFSENVQKGTGDIVIRKSSDNSVIETLPVTDARVSVAGTIATIDPATTLAGSTGYYVEVASGAFEDIPGNPFAGITGSGAWNFTTTAPGTYMYCDEPDSSWQLLHNFSDAGSPVARWNGAAWNNGDQNGVATTTRHWAGDDIGYVVYAGISGSGWANAGHTDITMPAGGDEFLLCYANNHGSGVVNIARNAYTNILDSHDYLTITNKLYQGTYTPGDVIIIWEDYAATHAFWMFIRNSGSPTIQTLSPANGSASAAGDADLVITFSGNVAKGSGNIVIRKISDNSVVETIPVSDAKVSVAGALATINPAATLDPETGYYVEAAAGTFEDASGNDFAGLYGSTHWNFTTASAAPPPAIIDSSGSGCPNGLVQTYVVPAGVASIHVQLWGAAGSRSYFSGTTYGGGGGYVEGDISVTPGETLKLKVACPVNQTLYYVLGDPVLYYGGWPEGGMGGQQWQYPWPGTSYPSQARTLGGGYTSIQRSDDTYLMVAGGGGGAGGLTSPDGVSFTINYGGPGGRSPSGSGPMAGGYGVGQNCPAGGYHDGPGGGGAGYTGGAGGTLTTFKANPSDWTHTSGTGGQGGTNYIGGLGVANGYSEQAPANTGVAAGSGRPGYPGGGVAQSTGGTTPWGGPGYAIITPLP